MNGVCRTCNAACSHASHAHGILRSKLFDNVWQRLPISLILHLRSSTQVLCDLSLFVIPALTACQPAGLPCMQRDDDGLGFDALESAAQKRKAAAPVDVDADDVQPRGKGSKKGKQPRASAQQQPATPSGAKSIKAPTGKRHAAKQVGARSKLNNSADGQHPAQGAKSARSARRFCLSKTSTKIRRCARNAARRFAMWPKLQRTRTASPGSEA